MVMRLKIYHDLPVLCGNRKRAAAIRPQLVTWPDDGWRILIGRRRSLKPNEYPERRKTGIPAWLVL